MTRGACTSTAPALVTHLPGLVVAVADHQPPPSLVPLIGERGDVVLHLGLQRRGQQPAGAVAHNLVDQRGGTNTGGGVLSTTTGVFAGYREHGSYLSDRRWRAGLA